MDTHPNYSKCTPNTHNTWNELPIPAWNHHHRYGYNRNNDWASSWIWWGQNHGAKLVADVSIYWFSRGCPLTNQTQTWMMVEKHMEIKLRW
jgi:hypothetical protein